MDRMTVLAACLVTGMGVKGVLLPGKGVKMALAAYSFLTAQEQVITVRGMRRMTLDAGVDRVNQVIMRGKKTLLDIILVAFKTLVGGYRTATIMAIITAFLIRWMKYVTDKISPVCAMGVVAGEAAVFRFSGKTLVACRDLPFGVTFAAQFSDIFPQEEEMI